MSRRLRKRDGGYVPDRLPPGIVCPDCHAYVLIVTASQSTYRRREALAAHATLEHPDHRSWLDRLPRPSLAALDRYRRSRR